MQIYVACYWLTCCFELVG